MKKKILIVNGPNLNLLGKREPEIYGTQSFEDFFLTLQKNFEQLAELQYYQSNHEGNLIDIIQEFGFKDFDIILNAGGYTHTSIALADCVSAVPCDVIEVHISDIKKRESFRHHSFLEAVCSHSIMGQGLDGYKQAIQVILSSK